MKELKFKIPQQSDLKLNGQSSKLFGFTLIELLVSFSLISIISGIGLASFVSYSRRQIVVQASAEVKQAIDLARFDAISQVKPSNLCADTDQLTSYTVNFCDFSAGCQQGGIDYEVEVNCGATTAVVLAKKLPQNVSFTNTGLPGQNVCSTLTFQTLSTIGAGGACDINVEGFNNRIKVSVDSSGYASYQ